MTLSDAELLRAYEAGEKIAWIAARDGRSRSTVTVALHRARRRSGIEVPTDPSPHAIDVVLTPLNRETTKRYRACVRDGGHEPSGKTVVRRPKATDLVMQVCARCGVPYL